MKSFKKLNFIFALLLAVLLTSCLNDEYNDLPSNGFAGFDFKTTKDVEINVSTFNVQNQAISGVYLSVYSTNPLKADGTLIENSSQFLLHKGATASNGKMEFAVSVPTHVDSIAILINYIGLPNLHMQKIASAKLNFTIGGNMQANTAARKMLQAPLALPTPTKVSGFYVLGTWNNVGFPNYLFLPSDIVSSDFLADVNATLPENIKLQESHPEYFASKDDGSVVLVEDAEVWVTFVHEGAGFRNTLGYYTHPNDQAPLRKEDIRDATILFPNVSYAGLGGMLTSGNKVQLLYLDPTTNLYSKRFPAGTTVAWWFRSNGFNGGSATSIANGYYNFYSDVRFNPEKNAAQRKHNVLLKDDARKLLLIGFEDIHRDQSPDDDFNDAVFYATVTPYTAIKQDIYQNIDTPKDTDGDGVSDTMDDYPTDPNKAYNNFYPSKNVNATLAFEDLWPSKGDYDFNDLVVDYNINQITNAKNQIVELNSKYTLRAIGASYRNAFAVELNMLPDNVKSVSGQLLNKQIFKLAANGTEKNQSKAVIVIFDNANDAISVPAQSSLINTVKGSTYYQPKTLNIKVELVNPITMSQFGTPPYNPFIVVNGERGREVHLPGSKPTDLVDKKLLGTMHDNTNLAAGKFYMSDKYLPWAINIPVSFDYPAEKQDITKTYLLFDAWANSRGYSHMDWYLPKAGFRDNEKIYTHK